MTCAIFITFVFLDKWFSFIQIVYYFLNAQFKTNQMYVFVLRVTFVQRLSGRNNVDVYAYIYMCLFVCLFVSTIFNEGAYLT